MALQVWLPLNGNLNNQGLTNVTVTNSGTTVDNNGKIGKCYAFNGSSKITNTLPTPIDSSIGTLACWFKMTSLPSSSGFYNLIQLGNLGGYATCRFGVYMEYSNRINISIDGSDLNTNAYTHSLTTNQWYHLCVTHDGTTVKLYIDGVEVLSKASTKGSYKTTASYLYVGGTSSYYLKGGMNDVRYYSTVLSPKEIEILSRGLVCHYPLNGNGRAGDNLLVGSQVNSYINGSLGSRAAGKFGANSGGNGTFQIIEDSTIPVGKYSYNVLNNTSGNRDYQQDEIPYVNGKKYTASWWAKGNGTCLFRVWNVTKSSQPYSVTYTLTSDWKYYTQTFTATQEMQDDNCTFHLGVTGNASIYIAGMKLEEGDKATPYMLNSADAMYSSMGYNSTTEYDVSGYQNNMTKTGTITYTSDSARYSVASHFINGSYLMANQNCGEYLPKDSLTVNLWVKPTTWGTPISCTEGGGWNFEAYNNGLQFQCMIANGVGYKPAWCNVTAASITDNKWHMLTGTFDRIAQQTKIYIDGVLKGTTATGSSNGIGYVANRLIISGEAQSTTPASSYFTGEESDVRIYATALSDTQVTELYNTAVSVANNGTLMGYELVEV